MKSLLTIVLICFASFGFGQSKKEINVQLKNKLVEKQVYYDSIYALHSAQVTTYPLTYSQYKTLMGEVKDKRREAQVLAEEIAMNNRKITALELELPKDLVLENVQRSDLPNYHMSEEDLNALSIEFEVREPISILDLSGVKRKEQNEKIATKIDVYESASHRMSGELVVLEKFQVTIKNLDTLNLWYDNLLKQYNEKNDVLKAELKKAEENYKTNGPDGFSKAYQTVFSVYPKYDPAKEPLVPQINVTYPPEPAPEPGIYGHPEELAQFPSGRQAMLEYIAKNLDLSGLKQDKMVSGKCYLKFQISETGTISDVKVLKGIPDCPECDAAAVAVVKGMPSWTPAKLYGKAINSYFNLPVTIDMK